MTTRKKIVVPKSTYRAWTPEEAIGKIVRKRLDDEYNVIIHVDPDKVIIPCEADCPSYQDLLDNYVQLNGEPCGVKEE